MARIRQLIALAIALPCVASHAIAIGAWNPPRYWDASALAHVRSLGAQTGWSSDYGTVSGRCNASLVGAVVDAAGNDDGLPLVATLHGAILGATPSLDATDRGCMGHALELAPSFFAVHWINPETRVRFTLTPMRRLSLRGNQCRLFSAEAMADGGRQVQRAIACRLGYGEWYVI